MNYLLSNTFFVDRAVNATYCSTGNNDALEKNSLQFLATNIDLSLLHIMITRFSFLPSVSLWVFL